jgi:hypothetical protein
MSSDNILEAALFVVAAFALGLSHVWNYNRSIRRKSEAEEALRLDAIRQEAVKQLKAEHRSWSRDKAPIREQLIEPEA